MSYKKENFLLLLSILNDELNGRVSANKIGDMLGLDVFQSQALANEYYENNITKTPETVINLENGKYIVKHTNGVNLRAYRYGELWRNLAGDNLILALVNKIEKLEDKLIK